MKYFLHGLLIGTPVVYRKASYHELRIGNPFRLDLSATMVAEPMPFARWFRNGYELPGEHDMSYSVQAVNLTHSGTYSCELRNIAGSFLWLEATLRVVEE